jgi:hypothetical protein
MELDERVTSALRAQTEPLPPFAPDVAMIRASAKAQTRRRAGIVVISAVVAVVAVIAVVTSGATNPGPDRSDGVEPIGTPSATPPDAVEQIDTSSWTTYASDRYSFEVGHPPNWTEAPSRRNWSFETDAADPTSPAHDAFVDPSGEIRVSAWEAPLDPEGNAACRKVVERTCVETNAYLLAWVEDYCEASNNSPCTGIADRAVDLCLEARDCHPGLLVPFDDDVQAFFSGGIYAGDAMTVVAVWRAESDPQLARYGGAQRLLESFLSTMEVWPASTPFDQRR